MPAKHILITAADNLYWEGHKIIYNMNPANLTFRPDGRILSDVFDPSVLWAACFSCFTSLVEYWTPDLERKGRMKLLESFLGNWLSS